MVACAYCQKPLDKPAGAINRAKKNGLPLFCNMTCSGLSRRKHKTAEQKKEEKRLYDMQYRAKNMEMLAQKKAARHQATYDPVEAAKYRKARMHKHVAYCQRPEYKKWKAEYDSKYRAKTEFGEYWESALLAVEIDKEITSRATKQ